MGRFELKTLGNILWFIFGGFIGGLVWILVGLLWCITIIGIPVGKQCFKFASLSFWPFGKDIVYSDNMFSIIINVIWILLFGWEMALGYLVIGCIWCVTIIGIPFGLQFFKLAKLAIMPLGADIVVAGMDYYS